MSDFYYRFPKPNTFNQKNTDSDKTDASQNTPFIRPKNDGQGIFGGPSFIQPKSLQTPTIDGVNTKNADEKEPTNGEEGNQQKKGNSAAKNGNLGKTLFIQPLRTKAAEDTVQLKGPEKRELTSDEQAIKDEFSEYVKIVEKRLFSDMTDKEKDKFTKNVKKFEKRMEKGLSNFGEFLKMGTWGSEDYFRLRDKFFPDYQSTIQDEIDSIKLNITTSLSHLTGVLNESIAITDLAISKASEDRDQAQSLITNAAAKLEEVKAKRAIVAETLSEYGNAENSTPILAQFDAVIARYEALISMFTSAFSGIETDITDFEEIKPEISKNKNALSNFEAKLANAKTLSAVQNLSSVELPALTNELNLLLEKAMNQTRKTAAVDEQSYQEEKSTMDATVGTLEGNTEKIKADEIERRRQAEIERQRLAELERKRLEAERKKEEEEARRKAAESQNKGTTAVSSDDKAMLELSPSEFFIVYEQRAQKYLDQYYNRSSWKSFKEKHSDIFLTGKELADAAKYVYDNAEKKDLKLIAPVELAVAQAKLEGGVKPKNKDARTVINPMNVGVHDGGNDNKKALSLFEIRDEKGWKAARKEGLRYYYRAMYKLWMPDYDTVEEMIEYDHFDKNGNTNYTGRYATSVYYEAKIKGEVGIMRMTENGELLSKTVGGGKGTVEDRKAVYKYLKAYDKYPEKLKDTKYSDLIKFENGVPTSSSLKSAILAIQENEIYPDPSTFGKNKKKVYDGMGADDKKGSTQARAKGTDGLAGKFGPTIGFLYYHYLLVGGSGVFNTQADVSAIDQQENEATNDVSPTVIDAGAELAGIKARYDKGEIDMIALGKEVVKYCKDYPDEVAEFIDSFSYYLDDNISYRLVKESTESEVKSWDYDLLLKLEKIMKPEYFRAEGDDERAVYKQLKDARVSKGAEIYDEFMSRMKETYGGDSETETTNSETSYVVSDGEARVRNENGQELNVSGGIHKKGEKYKIIPKGTDVVVSQEKDGRVKVKSTDGKTQYGWTNKSNLTRKVSASDIKTWRNKKVTASKISEKNKGYATLILEAEELGITKFSDAKVKQTFEKIKNLEKIGNGKKLGKSENYYSDPKETEIIIQATILSILQSEVDIWLSGDQKGQISDVKIGSFMIWNSYKKSGVDVSDELRTTNHGAKGRAIDINVDGTNFESNAALEMVNRIIANLPKIDGTYEVGLPFQGDFFPKDEKWTKTHKSGKLKMHTQATVSGSKVVLDYIKSEKLKKTFKDLQKKGYKFQLFPDYNNHLHLAVE